jgi:replicative DNA helicase
MSMAVFDDYGSSPVPFYRIAKGDVPDSDMPRLEEAAANLRDVPFWIEQKAGLNVAQIAARTRNAKLAMENRGIQLALVVVDHLGLVAPSGRYRGDRVREIGEISINLHSLARECGVHVMMLSQLSRAIESREDKRPQLHDLRESGEIEQNADQVMGVYREAYYLSKQDQTPEVISRLAEVGKLVEIGILKNRQGPVGQAVLFADMGSNAIRELNR